MCPACESKRVHGPADWANHPYATHGFNGTVWTHPKLDPHYVPDHAGAAPLAAGISGEATAEAPAAPAEGKV
jgi:hypothetical protein